MLRRRCRSLGMSMALAELDKAARKKKSRKRCRDTNKNFWMLRPCSSRGLSKMDKARKMRRKRCDMNVVNMHLSNKKDFGMLRACSSRGTSMDANDPPRLGNNSWDSTFPDAHNYFPSPPIWKPVYTRDELREQEKELGKMCEQDKQEHHSNQVYYKQDKDYYNVVEVMEISKGMHLNLEHLLSNPATNRDYLVTNSGLHVPVNHLHGKYVLIFCVEVPVHANSDVAHTCGALMAARSPGSRGSAPNFEIVIAADMSNGNWDDREDVFDHFFSGFHDDTLAIPFWDVVSRHRLCRSVGSGDALVIDPNGLVLQVGSTSYLDDYGSDCFPFTDEHLNSLLKADAILQFKWDSIYKERHMDYLSSLVGDAAAEEICSSPRPSLASLLGYASLSKINDPEVNIPVSKLSNKLVGIYLCSDGLEMDSFHMFQHRCLSCRPGFEMVLVCNVLAEHYSSFLDHIKLAMKKRDITSWWLFPNHEETRLRLARLGSCVGEELIIVPPGGKSAEVEGTDVLEVPEFFNFEYYPFTREAILEKRLSKLKSHTIDSLLEEFQYLVRGDDKDKINDTVRVADLKGKRIILYYDNFCDLSDYLNGHSLLELYPYIKREHINSEVVFLPSTENCTGNEVDWKMPWLKLPFPSKYVTDQLCRDMGDYFDLDGKLVTFGEDGKILSRDAAANIANSDAEGGTIDVSALFDDTLRQEIVENLSNLQSNYGIY